MDSAQSSGPPGSPAPLRSAFNVGVGGVFVAGDTVLAHHDDGSTALGIVRTVMGGFVEVQFPTGESDEFHPDRLTLLV